MSIIKGSRNLSHYNLMLNEVDGVSEVKFLDKETYEEEKDYKILTYYKENSLEYYQSYLLFDSKGYFIGVFETVKEMEKAINKMLIHWS